MPSSNVADWNVHTKALTKACLGQITSNFRLVSLNFHHDSWEVKIVTEIQKPEEIEIFDEIFSDYNLDLENSIIDYLSFEDVNFSEAVSLKTVLEIVVSSAPLSRENEQEFWVYLRRERWKKGLMLVEY